MPGKPRSPRKPPNTVTPESAREWLTTRELWDRASQAELDLERSGKPVNHETIWKVICKHAPEEQRSEPKMPLSIREALEHPGYTQLLDIRKRLLVVPALKNLGIMKELTAQASFVAMASALEDLMLHPERIPTSEKRQLTKTFMEMNLRLSGIKEEDAAKGETLTDIAAAEEAERARVLEGIPEQYRELMGQRWDEERMKNLRTRQAIHLTKVNENLGHAKSS